MANLPESSTFDAGVYQIETTDPVIGGPSGVTNTPLKNLANRTKYLKDQVDSLASTKAPLASPALTGTPTAPTAAGGTSTTQLATTAFVQSAVAAAAPDLTPYAPKASPVFTGNPVAPTPAQFDNDTSLATTAFVRGELGNFSDVGGMNATTTLNASHVGKILNPYGAGSYTLTLPQATTIPAGSVIQIFCTAANVTVQRAASEVIYTRSSPAKTAVVMNNGDWMSFVSRSDGWYAYGTAQLNDAPGFGSSIGGSGYQKLPSGLIIQWGITGWAAGASSGNVTFPIAFPNAGLSATVTYYGAASSANPAKGISCTLNATTLSLNAYQAMAGSGGQAFSWIAIGY